MTHNVLIFNGCTPAPIVSYLKALGIFRLLSCDANHVAGEAADPAARGWWEDECFRCRTSLDKDSMFRFFLYDYAPSPIIAPWNGGAGFLEGDSGSDSSRKGAKLMNAIQRSENARFEVMRRTIEMLRDNNTIKNYDKVRAEEKQLKKLKGLVGNEKARVDERRKILAKTIKQTKSLLLPTLRAATDSRHLDYIDACFVLSSDEISAPLLGSGGNDGNQEFGANFAERLNDLFEFEDGSPKRGSESQLEAALFDMEQRLEVVGSMGQFSPGQGGANATTGYERKKDEALLNAWDFVFAMEGSIVFAGALTRRWGAAGSSRGAFPFTFEPANAGAGNLSSFDPNHPRGEVWVPLWYKPATFSEVRAVFSEGRLTMGRRAARTGLDAARSIARMGQSRGIGGFERYSFVQPDAKMPYQATPLGRFNVPDIPRRDLIEDLEAGNWLERARQLVKSDLAPAHARLAMRRLEDALFQMTDAGRARVGTCNALMALGSFVTWLANSPKSHEQLAPPPLLSSQWVYGADDRSPEFRIAVALSGIGLPVSRSRDTQLRKEDNAEVNRPEDEQKKSAVLPMAAHFASIDQNFFVEGRNLRRNRRWSELATDPCVVWGAGSLVSNLTAVLERRLVEAAIHDLNHKPLDGAVYACLADIAKFLSGDFDDARCASLLAGLIWARPEEYRAQHSSASFPFAYAALKPVFTPDQTLRRIRLIPETAQIPIPPGLITRLRSAGPCVDGKATDEAVRTALARCRGSGVASAFDSSQAGIRVGARENSRMGVGVQADRLVAALLIPVGDTGLKALIDRVYPGAIPDDMNQSMEETDVV